MSCPQIICSDQNKYSYQAILTSSSLFLNKKNPDQINDQGESKQGGFTSGRRRSRHVGDPCFGPKPEGRSNVAIQQLILNILVKIVVYHRLYCIAPMHQTHNSSNSGFGAIAYGCWIIYITGLSIVTNQCQRQKERQHQEPRYLAALSHSGHRRSDYVFRL